MEVSRGFWILPGGLMGGPGDLENTMKGIRGIKFFPGGFGIFQGNLNFGDPL